MFKRLFQLLIITFMSSSVLAEVIQTENTNNSTITTNGSQQTTIKQPPPSAISPQISSGNGDLCTVGVAGAVQTQILGISAGTTFTEENCVRLKKASKLYDMGMKVAAVSVMCQDEDVFEAMMMAGTPCPYDGKIGNEARIAWEAHDPDSRPFNKKKDKEEKIDAKEAATWGFGSMLGWLLLL